MTFATHLKACMDSCAGHPRATPWTADELAKTTGLSEKVVRGWLNAKRPVKLQAESVGMLSRAFRYSVEERSDRGSTFRIVDELQHHALLRAAGWPSNIGDVAPQSTSESIGVPPDMLIAGPQLLAVFPADLPAEVSARRVAVLTSLERYLGATPLPAAHLLAPLPALFNLTPLRGVDNFEPGECGDLIIALASVIDECNGQLWAGSKVPGPQRREGCGRILMLLTALAWTQYGWHQLQALGLAESGKRIKQVRNPQLIQAGVHATAGERLALTFDRDWLRDQRPGMSTDTPPAEVWHLACGGFDGQIHPGPGLDFKAWLLESLAKVFAVPFPTLRADQRERQLEDFEPKLRARIRARTKRCFNADTRFMLSRQMAGDADREADVLFLHAQQLSCAPLAYTGTAEHRERADVKDLKWVRGDEQDEENLIAAIEECLDAIARIPDLAK